ncbi:MAG: ParB/RepB/Spo0J family partition protein [Firmicutes bacterium]|nr:ParB/RepB/Spo0J family partition protein [Bacillota bacterium]
MENAAVLSYNEVIYLSTDRIIPNPYQPRKNFDLVSLNELSRSIKKYGIIQPLCVRYAYGNKYEIISGERRLKAAIIAGLCIIPCVLYNKSDSESAVMALIENLQRDNLNFFEEAEAYQTLMVDFGYNQEKIAELVGKNQSTVSNKMRILKLNKNIKKMIYENGLSERHARALLRIKDENEQKEIIGKVVKHGLNVEKTEALIESFIKKREENYEDKKKIKFYFNDVSIFTSTIKNVVDSLKDAGVNTEYEVIKNESGCDIKISIRK